MIEVIALFFMHFKQNHSKCCLSKTKMLQKYSVLFCDLKRPNTTKASDTGVSNKKLSFKKKLESCGEDEWIKGP